MNLGVPNAELHYMGDGDYNLVLGPMTAMLSYDGSDYMVGDWQVWDVQLDVADAEGRTEKCSLGGNHVISEDSALARWLEGEARDERGHLADEPS